MKLTLFMVMSMNGIAAFDEQTDIRAYSSEEDHDFFINTASACDAAVMGRHSYNKEVTCRRKYLLTHGDLSMDADAGTVPVSGDVGDIYQKIKDDGNENVALIGGPRTNSAFLEKGLVDEIFLTIEPVILDAGIGFGLDSFRSHWTLCETIRLNEKGTIVQHYVREGQSAPEQFRYRKILKDPEFRDIMTRLKAAERDRIYCRHDMTHLLDTARIMQILNLEEGHGLPKDLIYAAGLLHDIGRLRQYEEGVPHEQAAVPIAEGIMARCGYTVQERELVLFAISVHRGGIKEGRARKDVFADILYRADKKGRLCFACEAYDECNWPEEKKNAEVFL